MNANLKSMPGNPEHCPFVNRAHPRCAEHLNLGNLDHALEYCFNRFEYCPVYVELMRERRKRWSSANRGDRSPYVASGFVQLKISAEHQKRSA